MQDACTVCPRHRHVGAAVSQPLLGPAAAPRGVGMSSAAGNVLCWCRGRAHRAHCGVVLAGMPWPASCRGRPRARCAAGGVRGGSCRWGTGAPGVGEPPCDASCPPAAGCSAPPVLEASRGFGVSVALARCPTRLARGSLAADKAALMATCCSKKAEHSDAFLSSLPQKDLR